MFMLKFRALLAVVLLGGFLTGPVFAAGSDSSDDQSSADKIKEAVQAIDKKDYRGAVSVLRGVIADDRRNADALNYLGYSHRKLGDYKNALTYYKQALKVDPTHKGANEYIGQAYLELKQPDNAKIHLDELKRICGTDCEEYASLKKALDAFRGNAPKS